MKSLRSFSILFLITFVLSYKALHASDKTLRIVAPYLPENVETGGQEGRDVKIFQTILKCVGKKSKIDVQPYMRHVKSYLTDDKEIYDGIMTVPDYSKEILNQTQPYIAYHNGVIVRSEDFPEGVKSIDSLKGKHIISFIGGENLLKGLSNNTKVFASYVETATQYRHNEMLMKGRVDGVFSDGLIFMAHQKRLLEKEPRWQKIKVKFYQIFSLNNFSAAFRNPQITKAFNKCLTKLNKDGTLNHIERSFSDKYHDILGDEYSKPLIR